MGSDLLRFFGRRRRRIWVATMQDFGWSSTVGARTCLWAAAGSLLGCRLEAVGVLFCGQAEATRVLNVGVLNGGDGGRLAAVKAPAGSAIVGARGLYADGAVFFFQLLFGAERAWVLVRCHFFPSIFLCLILFSFLRVWIRVLRSFLRACGDMVDTLRSVCGVRCFDLHFEVLLGACSFWFSFLASF
uniref:Uncharacterized protein n=1 Tax=Picea sitchensis TaxID=3332 RepID=A9NPY4_PICSI|nr:unknown [Picea sitchensis]